MVSGFPQPKMDQYFLDQGLILNKRNNLHWPLALGA
jgi:hypothetical protein